MEGTFIVPRMGVTITGIKTLVGSAVITYTDGDAEGMKLRVENRMGNGCKVGKRIVGPDKVHELVPGFAIASNTGNRLDLRQPDGTVTGPRSVNLPMQY